MSPVDGHKPDWRALEASEEFGDLRAARRRFVIGTLVLFTAAVGGFLVCTAYARGFMGKSVSGSLTVGYVWLFGLTLLTWVIAWGYLRFSTRRLGPTSEAVARKANGDGRR
jgi:uncharacterized membrane protein (DUF485 family)